MELVCRCKAAIKTATIVQARQHFSLGLRRQVGIFLLMEVELQDRSEEPRRNGRNRQVVKSFELDSIDRIAVSREGTGPLARGRAIQHLLGGLVKHGLARVLRANHRGVVGLVGSGPRRDVEILELLDHDGASLVLHFVVQLSLLVQMTVLNCEVGAAVI